MRAIACTLARTHAAPVMSPFINAMLAAGLSEMPPLPIVQTRMKNTV